MQTMDQFSHDLTLALEETSRTGGVRAGRWGQRRRTRSTGNLPCAPQPTEDSSSSPAPNEIHQQQNNNTGGGDGSMHSDSDDRHDLRLSFQQKSTRHVGNFESDSLNENFSPARFFRPNTRRKRKFKRMAVEYETTPSTPGLQGDKSIIDGTKNMNASASGEHITKMNTMFPITGGAVKKRVLKHIMQQDNYRTNLFFCGKRKRSHRDRYHDHHHHINKLHSSSVPRQTSYIFTTTSTNNSYNNIDYQYKTRTRSFSSATSTSTKSNCEKILPLNKLLISKIEKIAQQQSPINKLHPTGFQFTPIVLNPTVPMSEILYDRQKLLDNNCCGDGISDTSRNIFETKKMFSNSTINTTQQQHTSTTQHHYLSQIPENIAVRCNSNNNNCKLQKSIGNFDTTTLFTTITKPTTIKSISTALMSSNELQKSSVERNKTSSTGSAVGGRRKHHHKNHHHRLRREIRAKLQFEVDPHSMECNDLNDFLSSSSSLSSTDSEADETNDSDREGDDELTDWPGNEAMINFASKNDFKRKSAIKKTQLLPLIKSTAIIPASTDDYGTGIGGCISICDDDTLINDELSVPTNDIINNCTSYPLQVKPTSFLQQSQPIPITTNHQQLYGFGGFSGNCDSMMGGNCTDDGGGGDGISYNKFNNNNNNLSGGHNHHHNNNFRFPVKQIESEMSGETSNPFLSSPPYHRINEIREIRAGCRRIKEERPGFSIKTSVNERLARFLHDARQSYIRLPDLDAHEHESLGNYAKLYSLEMIVDNGCAVLSKTSNTTQSVKVDQQNFGSRFFLSDFKRVRCYDSRSGSVETNDSFNNPDNCFDDGGGGGDSGNLITNSSNINTNIDTITNCITTQQQKMTTS